MTVTRTRQDEHGAAAVEFALVLPLLLALVLGLIELSLIFNTQISLTNGAREGARVMAITNDATQARNAAIAATPSINPAVTAGDIVINPSNCAAGATVDVRIQYDSALVTGLFVPIFGAALALEGRGVMSCGG